MARGGFELRTKAFIEGPTNQVSPMMQQLALWFAFRGQNFLNFCLSSLSALKCEVLHFYLVRFSLSVFSVFGEPRGSCKKSHCPCPRFLSLSLVIVFRVCVFRTRTERLVTDPTRACFPRQATGTPLPCAASSTEGAEPEEEVSKCWTSEQDLPCCPLHRRTNQTT